MKTYGSVGIAPQILVRDTWRCLYFVAMSTAGAEYVSVEVPMISSSSVYKCANYVECLFPDKSAPIFEIKW
jgi:hypothetical protein